VESVRSAMGAVIDRVHDSQEVSAETARVMESMAAGVSQAASANDQIADASRRQLDQFSEMQASLERLFATLTESSTKVETTARIGDDLYRVTGRMSDLMSGFVIQEALTSEFRKPEGEKRQYPRLEYGMLTEVAQEGEGGQTQEALAVDFSISGARLAVAHALKPHLPLVVRLRPPAADIAAYQRQEPLEVRARIAWQRVDGGKQMAGIEFIGLSFSQKEKLKECFGYFRKSPEYS